MVFRSEVDGGSITTVVVPERRRADIELELAEWRLGGRAADSAFVHVGTGGVLLHFHTCRDAERAVRLIGAAPWVRVDGPGQAVGRARPARTNPARLGLNLNLTFKQDGN